MPNFLLVPIHLDALYLPTDQFVTAAMADFHRFPYFDGVRDVNANVPYLSEEIATPPFANQNLRLQAGIHLHWALPDALTQGTQSDTGDQQFPPVPNRWLVTRQVGAETMRWVVESDYLHPIGANATAVVAPWPLTAQDGSARPRHVGRVRPYAEWLADSSPAERWDRLTAVGYGEPTFAAFYPNCHSLFGWHDADYQATVPAGLQYDVLGWYQSAQQDYLQRLLAAAKVPTPEQVAQLLQSQAAWQLLEADANFPTQMICYARLTFPAGLQATAAPQVQRSQPPELRIAVGNTGTEALAAHLAARIAGGDDLRARQIEDKLEAIVATEQLEQIVLDLGPHFKEVRHTNGFRAVPAGLRWTIRQESNAAESAAAITQARLAPPPQARGRRVSRQVVWTDLAQALTLLNQRQAAYDRAQAELAAARTQLFADWYKYMLCAYPTGALDDYPAVDEVKGWIERGLARLQGQAAQTGTLRLAIDAQGNVMEAVAAEPTVNSLATALAQAINALLALVAAFNDAEEPLPLRLRPLADARYWQPQEPVVLMVGDAVKPSPRHGRDGRLSPDGLLLCERLTSAAADVEGLVRQDPALVTARLDAIRAATDDELIGFSAWTSPWHPILLEWEVELFPVRAGVNTETRDQEYAADFITANYGLDEDEGELVLQSGRGAVGRAVNLYRGRSYLTFHATEQLKAKLDAYLATSTSQPDPDLVQASELLADSNFNSLAQALSGLNDAFLMHRQSMQLPIADPLGFSEYQDFAGAVAATVGNQIGLAPEPLMDFNPIRTGVMQLNRLRLIDSFGQVQELDTTKLFPATALAVPESDHLIHLPPRLVQPAALRFRLLAADDGDSEANAHPDTNPICGWLLPNDLDNSLAIYNSDGLALGAVTANPLHPWTPAPGSAAAVDSPTAITDPHLRKVVDYLLDHGSAFVGQFLNMIGNALARIEPESAAQYPELALLMGRPLALVRAQVSLALQGLPAIHQSWQALRQDLHRISRDSDNFPNVRFPVHLGAYQRWNDGLVGFWREDGDGQWGETFYAPQSAPPADGADDSSWTSVTSPLIRLGDAPDFHLQLALTTPPQTVVLLWDPRAPLHLLSGFLPVKTIALPPDHYVAALQAIEVTFFTAPLLTETNKVRLPLPSEPGYRWSWLQNKAGRWAEVGTVGIVTRGDFGQAFGDAGDALWAELIALDWLTNVDADRAAVAAKDQRSATPLSPAAEPYRGTLEDLLERSHIGPPQTEATFAGPQGLCDGWLTLRMAPTTDAEPLTLTRMRKRSI